MGLVVYGRLKSRVQFPRRAPVAGVRFPTLFFI